jgi:hypothetical protein
VRVDAAGAFFLVEHGADDMARERAVLLRACERRDASVDLRAGLRREEIEPLAQQLPLGAHHPRDLGEAMAARVATATTGPPVMTVVRGSRAPLHVLVHGEQPVSRARHLAVSTHSPP